MSLEQIREVIDTAWYQGYWTAVGVIAVSSLIGYFIRKVSNYYGFKN